MIFQWKALPDGAWYLATPEEFATLKELGLRYELHPFEKRGASHWFVLVRADEMRLVSELETVMECRKESNG